MISATDHDGVQPLMASALDWTSLGALDVARGVRRLRADLGPAPVGVAASLCAPGVQVQPGRLTPAQHQLLLAIRGHRQDQGLTVGEVADDLLLRHHGVGGLIDGLAPVQRPHGFPGEPEAPSSEPHCRPVAGGDGALGPAQR